MKLMETSNGYKLIHDDVCRGKIDGHVEDGYYLLDYIHINKAHRGKGYGRMAINALKRKYKKIKTTTVRKSNTASRALFNSAGFREIPSGAQLRFEL
jgi:ribosomal protein S18 acetylase RimI-like enzyme